MSNLIALMFVTSVLTFASIFLTMTITSHADRLDTLEQHHAEVHPVEAEEG